MKKWVATDVPTIPKRELTFDVSEETTKVFIDPKALVSNTNLQQLRYVARVDVLVPPSPNGFGGISGLGMGGMGMMGSMGMGPASGAMYSSPMRLDKLAADLPKQHLLPDDVLTELLAQGRYLTSRYEQQVSAETGTVIGNVRATYAVLAPTAERARELSYGMLALLDYGLYWPRHQPQLDQLKVRQRELSEYRAKLLAEEAAVGKLEEELERLAEYSDIDAELLRSLITQQRLIGVDLAGVTARLEACAELLGKTHNPSVEGLRVTAEIELVGLTAKKSALDAIVKAATAREETLKNIRRARASENKHGQIVGSVERAVAELRTDIKMSKPPVVKGDVTIRRIEWRPVGGGGGYPPGASKPWWVE